MFITVGRSNETGNIKVTSANVFFNNPNVNQTRYFNMMIFTYAGNTAANHSDTSSVYHNDTFLSRNGHSFYWEFYDNSPGDVDSGYYFTYEIDEPLLGSGVSYWMSLCKQA